ncbi:hypothetical protein Tco_1547635 [Tanacetum coccineum]
MSGAGCSPTDSNPGQDHLAKFHKINDAKEMWEAIKSRFGGNDESKKIQKYILKQQFEGFSISNSEGLHKGYDRNRLGLTKPKSSATVVTKQDILLESADPKGIKMGGEEMLRTLGIRKKTMGEDLGSDTEVTSCSKECKESYVKLKKLYDEQREQLGDASIEIQAYTQALKKVEAQLVAHQQEAEKEKEDLKAKVEKWHNSSKNLNILLNSQMSARDKAGLGYGDQLNKGVLSYENEVFQSVFVSRTSETENSPVNDRYAEGMHAVPPPMTGIYIPSGPDKEIDDS